VGRGRGALAPPDQISCGVVNAQQGFALGRLVCCWVLGEGSELGCPSFRRCETSGSEDGGRSPAASGGVQRAVDQGGVRVPAPRGSEGDREGGLGAGRLRANGASPPPAFGAPSELVCAVVLQMKSLVEKVDRVEKRLAAINFTHEEVVDPRKQQAILAGYASRLRQQRYGTTPPPDVAARCTLV
jgi:hypothetical protein